MYYIKKYWVRIAVLIGFAFVAAALYITEPEHMHIFHVIRAAALAISIGLVFTYTKTSILSIIQKEPWDSARGLIFGIWLTWLGIVIHSVTNIVAQFYPYPPEIVHSDFGAIGMAISGLGGLMTLASSQFLIKSRIAFIGIWIMVIISVLAILGYWGAPEVWWQSRYWIINK